MTPARSAIIASLLKDLSTVGRFAMHRADRERTGLIQSRTQLGVLFVLAHHGAQSLKELADRFVMTSSAATQTIDELEAVGLVARQADTDDRRKVNVILTDEGKQQLSAAKLERVKQLKTLLEVLSDDELQQLHAIERKIVGRIQELYCKPGKAKA